jgi:aryl-alcohol dehydrogenase-like predicted oxidoreductase
MSNKKYSEMNIILGTAQFGVEYGILNFSGRPLTEEVFSTLDMAWSCGIRVLDSAQAYGQANKIIADYHATRPHRFSVINKVMRHSESVEETLSSLRHELGALKIDSFDCIMLHHSASVPASLPKSFLDGLKGDGIAKRVGISIETPEDYRALQGRFNFDVVQLPLNVLNQKFMPDQFLDELKNKNIEIHARSAFSQGLLIGKIQEIPAYLQTVIPNVRSFQEDCLALEISPITGCLLYLLHNSAIDNIVVGAQNQSQLAEIMGAFGAAQGARQQGKKLDWNSYACHNFDLVSPLIWLKLKEESQCKAI